MAPIELTTWYRRYPSSMHTVCFSPPNICSSEVLHAITDDTAKGTTHGVQYFDPCANKVRKFLDPCWCT